MNLKGARTQGHPLYDAFIMPFVDALEQFIHEVYHMEWQDALEAGPRFTARVAEIVAKLPPDESV